MQAEQILYGAIAKVDEDFWIERSKFKGKDYKSAIQYLIEPNKMSKLQMYSFKLNDRDPNTQFVYVIMQQDSSSGSRKTKWLYVCVATNKFKKRICQKFCQKLQSVHGDEKQLNFTTNKKELEKLIKDNIQSHNQPTKRGIDIISECEELIQMRTEEVNAIIDKTLESGELIEIAVLKTDDTVAKAQLMKNNSAKLKKAALSKSSKLVVCGVITLILMIIILVVIVTLVIVQPWKKIEAKVPSSL